MYLAKARKHRLPRCVVKWRNADRFTSVEADQRSVNQLSYLRRHGKRVDVDAGTLPDFGACRRGHITSNRLARSNCPIPPNEAAEFILLFHPRHRKVDVRD
jgi:hypothetical protein